MNGQAIYGTRPWKQFGDGKIRFTAKGESLYAIFPAKPGGEISIRALPSSTAKITKVELLDGSKALEFSQDDQGLKVKLPNDLEDAPARAFRITGVIP